MDLSRERWDAEEIADMMRLASAQRGVPFDPVASLRQAADAVEGANPRAAERLRFYAQCANLGIDPRLIHDPFLFAMEVVARQTPEPDEG